MAAVACPSGCVLRATLIKSLVLEATRPLGAPLGQRARASADDSLGPQALRVHELSCRTAPASGQYQGGRRRTSVCTRGSLRGHSTPKAGGKARLMPQGPPGPQTSVCCSA